jgi:hypothetical protein
VLPDLRSELQDVLPIYALEGLFGNLRKAVDQKLFSFTWTGHDEASTLLQAMESWCGSLFPFIRLAWMGLNKSLRFGAKRSVFCVTEISESALAGFGADGKSLMLGGFVRFSADVDAALKSRPGGTATAGCLAVLVELESAREVGDDAIDPDVLWLPPFHVVKIVNATRNGGHGLAEIVLRDVAMDHDIGPVAGPAAVTAEEVFQAAVQLRLGPAGDKRDSAGKFKEAADLGHIKAQGEYALCLFDGCGVMINEPEAVRYAQLAAENGDALGHAVLARALRRGTGAVEDAIKAPEHAKKSADVGNLFGMAEWGICLLRAVGVAADQPRGVYLCRSSAEGGCVWGIIAWGGCLEDGEGVAQDEAEAVRCYRLGADQGHAAGQFQVGR